jgi:hypothetical protein
MQEQQLRPGRLKGMPKTGGCKAGTPNKATQDLKRLARLDGSDTVTEPIRLCTQAESETTRVAAIKERQGHSADRRRGERSTDQRRN